MLTIEEIIKSNLKPKEKTTSLANKLKSDKNSIKQAIDYYQKATVTEKGIIIEAIEYVTIKNPKSASSCLDFVIEKINDKAPKVKWEADRIIANVAKEFPDKVEAVIPKLFENTKDEGTVVRWSAAFALGEIAKSNPKTQKQLTPFFTEVVKKEKNKGVKNVYLKALKALGK